LILGWRIGLRERIVLTEAHNLYDPGGVVRFTRRIILLAVAIEAVGAAILAARFAVEMPVPRAVYFGIFHSVSAFNNAGFDLMGGFRSLTGYVGDPLVSLTVCGLIILGGIGFTVMLDVWNRRLNLHSKAVLLTTGALIAVGTVLILGLEFNNTKTLGAVSLPARVLAAFFQSVTPRTAGFNTLDIGAMTEPVLILIVALMFIGASPGGTGGGIKTTTFLTPLAVIWCSIRGTGEPVMFKRRIPVFVVYKAVTVVLISVAFVITAAMLLARVEGIRFVPALFEVTSGFGTVGLSTGITPHLSSWGRVVVMATIFSGRVGLLTLAFGLTRRHRVPIIRYPEERLYVG
jgi:trk system potassium uptake protein TrkH